MCHVVGVVHGSFGSADHATTLGWPTTLPWSSPRSLCVAEAIGASPPAASNGPPPEALYAHA